MKKVGVFADVSNLYYSLKKTNRRKLDYAKYLKFVSDFGEIELAIAYGAQQDSEAENFIKCLENVGFITKYRKPKKFHNKWKADWDVGIAVDMIAKMDEIDLFILGSADGDMAPVVEFLTFNGKEVIVLAAGISGELNVAKEVIEIADSLLED